MSEAVVYEQLDQDPAPTAGGASASDRPEGGQGTEVRQAGEGTGVLEAQGTGVPSSSEENGRDTDLRRLSDVPVELSVEIGRTRMTVGETLKLRAGAIVTLERLAGEPVDLLVNGTPIARGEVVVVDEQFGLRLTEITEGDPNQPKIEDVATGEVAPTPDERPPAERPPAGDEPARPDATVQE
jgi:flagellar motor switch protein FliN